jgi:hypothetical protein
MMVQNVEGINFCFNVFDKRIALVIDLSKLLVRKSHWRQAALMLVNTE